MSLKDFLTNRFFVLANRFFKWAVHSLKGHLVLFGLTFGVCESVVALYANYARGTLYFSWGVWVVFISVAVGVACGVLIWYTITWPRIKSREQRAKR
jgi:Ni/Fe-hydrogenase subunit HybB-like protein